MALSSSDDLHPTTGARFVFKRHGDQPRYTITVYLADGQTLHTELHWSDATPIFEPPVPDPWAQAECTKLARPLRRTPKPTMTCWRGR